MPKIFISYRRDDIPLVADQIYRWLIQRVPEDDVFMDVDSIQYGTDFLASIERHIILADVVLVPIGPRWNGQPDERKLMIQNDFVRFELEMALRHQKRLLPIFVGPEAQFPPSDELPPSLATLSHLNALRFPATLSQEEENQLMRFILPQRRKYTRRAVLGSTVGLGGLVAITLYLLTHPFSSHSNTPHPNNTPQSSFQTIIYKGHTNIVDSVTWSPDGKYIASAGNDKSVHIWEALTAKTLQLYTGHTQYVNSATWSPDGKYIASAGVDKTVQIWEALTAKPVQTYTKHIDIILSTAWSPVGQHIASAGYDKSVQICEAFTGKIVQIYGGHTDAVSDVTWSPGSQYIASASMDNTVQIWEALTAKTLQTYKQHIDAVSNAVWSPDGKYIASASWDSTVQIWEALTAKPMQIYKGHTSRVYSAAWSPNSKYVASAGMDHTVQVWLVSLN